MQLSQSQLEMPALLQNAANLDTVAPITVADLVCTRVVRLPAWFTVAQATRVAELRGVDQVLVEAQGRIRGSVSVAVLKQGPGLDTLSRRLSRSELFIDAGLRASEAAALMRLHGIACAPVSKGGMLVGTVSVERLQRALTPDVDAADLAVAA